ncbi:response regulator transcription factor [Cohnella laeviribosi]|uniref:response regulator transcription factor n=1 Tax=Cohnella laeviribosi TaxID=380174 RepID=UPI00037A2833|nr:response regulator [Cohnella laeviribosi]
MNNVSAVRKLNDRMYQAVLEKFWFGDRKKPVSCGILLVRSVHAYDEMLEAVRGLIETERRLPAEVLADPAGRQAAFLLFDSPWSETHYLALMVKGLLKNIADGEYAVMLARVKDRAERNPQWFEEVVELFEQLPATEEIVLFHERKAATESQSVLLVDGDEEVRGYLQLRLKMKGYRVLAARDGRQGLDLFRREKPDVVVTDLNLSGIDGYHLLTRLRGEDPDAGSKIVVFTDNRVEEAKRKCFELGVDDYVTKPFSPADLEARIERLL